jgi:hypothetical protein
METLRFTQASDVWSFGITVLEIFTDGARPYGNLDNAAVINRVQAGYRMPQPEGCSSAIYGTVRTCWSLYADDRPTFSDLVVLLEPLASDRESAALPDHSDDFGDPSGADAYTGLASEGGGDEAAIAVARDADYSAAIAVPERGGDGTDRHIVYPVSYKATELSYDGPRRNPIPPLMAHVGGRVGTSTPHPTKVPTLAATAGSGAISPATEVAPRTATDGIGVGNPDTQRNGQRVVNLAVPEATIQSSERANGVQAPGGVYEI